MQIIKDYLIKKFVPEYDELVWRSNLSEAYSGFFPRFLDEQIVEHQFQGEVTTDGEYKDIAVLFTDVRGFTALSQRKSMRVTNSLVNNFYDMIIHHTQAHGGIVDKFMGDGTMSLFGVYDDNDEYVREAVDAARAVAKDFSDMTSQKHQPEISLGIGINYGTALVGTFGNGEFLSFTALGHTVNLAARIQGKAENNKVFISQSVADFLEPPEYTGAGKYELKGVDKPVQLFEVL